VVGSAGGAAKVARVRELGFDAAFDYKTVALDAALAEAAPNGIDVYFDNVGGAHLQAAITSMRNFGRIVLCGAISQYNNTEPQPGPNNLFQLIAKRLTMRGFIVVDHAARRDAFVADMSRWIADGSVRYDETVVDGFENAPSAFLAMLRGDNLGKMLVRVGPSPA
jgi:hypothetical protein